MEQPTPQDIVFAQSHYIHTPLAVSYRHGWEARHRGEPLNVDVYKHATYSWFAAGYHDADIALGHSIFDLRDLPCPTSTGSWPLVATGAAADTADPARP